MENGVTVDSLQCCFQLLNETRHYAASIVLLLKYNITIQYSIVRGSIIWSADAAAASSPMRFCPSLSIEMFGVACLFVFGVWFLVWSDDFQGSITISQCGLVGLKQYREFTDKYCVGFVQLLCGWVLGPFSESNGFAHHYSGSFGKRADGIPPQAGAESDADT
mmetsp:Transcript_5754/g.16428  ORF Transcript_5754/g.16428 Transcript_5754/m.16428 type:complete len:163 (-) Transcript_5754:1017-1505(-)